MKNLVIVESPAKAHTIERFLSDDYRVVASMGHIRDLPKTKLGVDIEHDFSPDYVVSKEKNKTVKELKKYANQAHEIILATDEDREGEAIAWHLVEALNLNSEATKRVVFHEITREAVVAALRSPRTLDIPMVHAQQARRILDRLVGYKLSPFLWYKVMPGLSAGRVQSVAVRLIVERERERQAFKSQEYWSLEGLFNKKIDSGSFSAQLHSLDGNKVNIISQGEADAVIPMLQSASYAVSSLEKKERFRQPYAPFTTSTLQQDASRKLGFSAKKTMLIAQQLYEGVEIGSQGRTGLITYMRTDSLHLATSAVEQIRSVIQRQFGANYLPAKPRFFKTKTKGAQEAHEAIRPTFPDRDPQSLATFLSRDQYRLYDLIYKRTLACQMQPALYDQTSVEITGISPDPSASHRQCLFKTTGSVIRFPGFLAVYEEGKDDDPSNLPNHNGSKEEEKVLPVLTSGEALDLTKINPEQHFTQPPPRYTEATLVKALEEHGIGRPSTYAPIISTIQERGYVRLEQRRFVPEDIGQVVNDVLVEHFPDIVDIGFTAGMELGLDAIAEDKKPWVQLIRSFYDPFAILLEQKTKDVSKREILDEKTDQTCDKCGKPMVIRLGRYGKFLACTGYPECKNTKPLDKPAETLPGGNSSNGTDAAPSENTRKEPCEKCGAPMTLKKGRYGKFWGCTKYPECKNIQPLYPPKPIGVPCPKCGADLVTKRTKSKKIFYGCSKYPACDYATWKKPE